MRGAALLRTGRGDAAAATWIFRRGDAAATRTFGRDRRARAQDMLKAEGRHVFHESVNCRRFERLSIDTPKPMWINVDGELVGKTPLAMEVLPLALPLLV